MKITSLDGVRPAAPGDAGGEGEAGEVITRLSDAWRLARGGQGTGGGDDLS